MLQLGIKYHVDALREHALSLLRMQFPTTLDAFDKLKLPSTRRISTGYSAAAAVKMIALAWKFELYELLPSAFYASIKVTSTSLFEPFSDTRGTLWELTRDDLKRCVVGRDKLFAHCTAQYRMVITCSASPNCSQELQCEAELRDVQDMLFRDWPGGELYNPLSDFDWLIYDNHLCRRCNTALVKELTAGRRAAWLDLPSVFGLKDIVSCWPSVSDDDV